MSAEEQYMQIEKNNRTFQGMEIELTNLKEKYDAQNSRLIRSTVDGERLFKSLTTPPHDV